MKIKFIFTTVSVFFVLIGSSQIINTVAGTGLLPTNIPATESQLNSPAGILVDPNNNIFYSDAGFSVVRKISSSGIITDYAGTSTYGYSGDGGQANLAQLKGPVGVAIDQFGNKYIADSRANVIRKVTPSGIISTVAGNGNAGFSGDGGPAVLAELNYPLGVAVDASGNLYITDNLNNRIRKISSGGIITTIAGDGNAAFSGDGGDATLASINSPYGVVFHNGDVVFADTYNFRIRKIDNSGTISTIAGLGIPFSTGDGNDALSAAFVPLALCYDAQNSLLLTDYQGNKLRKIDGQTNIVSTIAGTGQAGFSGDGGPANLAKLNTPTGIALLTNGEILVCDAFNSRIRKIDLSNNISTIAGSPQNNIAFANSWKIQPEDISLNESNGQVVFSEFFSYVVRKYDPGTGMLYPVVGTGVKGYSGDNGLAIYAKVDTVMGVFYDSTGVYFSDSGNNRIRKVNNNGIVTTIAGTGTAGYSGDGGLATAAKISFPIGLKIYNNQLYFSDFRNFVIRKIDLATGVITTIAGNGTFGYSGDGGLAINASIGDCYHLDIDNLGNIYLTQDDFNVIRKIDNSGMISTIAGTGVSGYSGDNGLAVNAELNKPYGIAVDNNGNVFFSDRYNYRIRKINAAGLITTEAFTGQVGFSGDGGSAINAQCNAVTTLDIDGLGNSIYIADNGNNRVRLISNLATPDICVVSTDSLSEYNTIIWDKTNYFNVDSFIVYREALSNPITYIKIGALDYDEFSEFIDTNRTYFNSNQLPNGDPAISTYRYKIKIRDNQSNFSHFSSYHNSVYLNDLQNGTFQWNLYDIENGTSPVSAYQLYRDSISNGNWELIGTTSGTQTQLTDVNYFTYQQTGSWRVVADGFSCTPTRAGVNTSRSNIKNAPSVNIVSEISESSFEVFPNPFNNNLVVRCNSSNSFIGVVIYDLSGRVVLQSKLSGIENHLNLSEFNSGVYLLKIHSKEGNYNTKIMKQ